MIVNLPKFFVLGPPHRGITWLSELLNAHPNVYLPQQENLNYFSNDEFYRKGIGFYYSMFSNAREGMLKGDIAADYILYPQKVIKRLRYLYSSDIKDLKFIVYLKNPVVRLLDDYLGNMDSGLEDLPLEKAIERERKLLENPRYIKTGTSLGLYLNSSKYYSLLKPWMEAYQPHQFLFITDLDLEENSEATVSKIFSFLGLEESLGNKRKDILFRTRDTKLLNGIKHLLFKEEGSLEKNVTTKSDANRHKNRLEEAEIPRYISEMLNEEIDKLQGVIQQNLESWYSNSPGLLAV